MLKQFKEISKVKCKRKYEYKYKNCNCKNKRQHLVKTIGLEKKSFSF